MGDKKTFASKDKVAFQVESLYESKNSKALLCYPGILFYIHTTLKQ